MILWLRWERARWALGLVQGREGEGRCSPHFGVDRCKGDILPACVRLLTLWLRTPPGCWETTQQSQALASWAARSAPGANHTSDTPERFHTLPSSWKRFALLSRAVVFSICSIRSSALLWPRLWWRLHPPQHAAACGKCVPWAGAAVRLVLRWSDAVVLVRIIAHAGVNALSWWCPRLSWEWTSESRAGLTAGWMNRVTHLGS